MKFTSTLIKGKLIKRYKRFFTDVKIDEEIVFETWFGENEIAENFISYIFSSGFIITSFQICTGARTRQG